jgi:prephenate dehydratase
MKNQCPHCGSKKIKKEIKIIGNYPNTITFCSMCKAHIDADPEIVYSAPAFDTECKKYSEQTGIGVDRDNLFKE